MGKPISVGFWEWGCPKRGRFPYHCNLSLGFWKPIPVHTDMLNGLEHDFLLHQRTPTSCLLRKGLSPCASKSTGKRVKRSHLPLALTVLVYQEIIRLRLLHPRRPRCSYLGRDNHGWNHCKKSLQGEQESNFYNGLTCDYPVPTSCTWVSEVGGDGIPPPPPKKKKR